MDRRNTRQIVMVPVSWVTSHCGGISSLDHVTLVVRVATFQFILSKMVFWLGERWVIPTRLDAECWCL